MLLLGPTPISATVPYEGGSNDGHSVAEQTAAEVTDDDSAGGCFIASAKHENPVLSAPKAAPRSRELVFIGRTSRLPLFFLVLNGLVIALLVALRR